VAQVQQPSRQRPVPPFSGKYERHVWEHAAWVAQEPTCPLAGLNGHVAAAPCVDAISWLAPKASDAAMAALNNVLDTAAALIMGSSW
jgi:hypothetical protein